MVPLKLKADRSGNNTHGRSEFQENSENAMNDHNKPGESRRGQASRYTWSARHCFHSTAGLHVYPVHLAESGRGLVSVIRRVSCNLHLLQNLKSQSNNNFCSLPPPPRLCHSHPALAWRGWQNEKQDSRACGVAIGSSLPEWDEDVGGQNAAACQPPGTIGPFRDHQHRAGAAAEA